MRKLRIYVDTSVFGGYFDEEFSSWSKLFIEEIKSGKYVCVVSDITLRELKNAPIFVQDIYNSISEENIEFVILDEDAIFLSEKYIQEKAISKNFIADAQHIAIATVNRVDLLLSWNFKHIVNFQKIRLYNSVNMKYGYGLLEIRSPMEVSNEKPGS